MLYTGNTAAGIDLVKAYAWFSVAAVQGHEQAKQAIQVLAAAFSPEQLKNAQAQARILYEKLAPKSRQKK
jgi:TPR repeat protein